ncbi:MAG: HyaD/HybD family hydrogenase maturation endopeptidase [Chromatiales bacterium]|nr:HyaD/HybD family hydrogenase maturation endopeptidase [Chromatiales bacterium]
MLVLGIGNILWADEGFGVRAVEELNRQYQFDSNVTLMDGGTQGLYLVQHVRETDILIVFDAIDYGLVPGTLKLIEGDDVPRFMGAKKMSLHQTGFQEVLSTAELLGDYPEHLLLIGVQPEVLEDYGGSLRPVVKAQIQPAIEVALAFLEKHGIQAERREAVIADSVSITSRALELERYEQERPSSEAACRVGDARILNDARIEFSPQQLLEETGRLQVDVDHRGKY